MQKIKLSAAFLICTLAVAVMVYFLSTPLLAVDPVVRTTTGTINGSNVVSFSATPAFDLSLGWLQKITLTSNVTSSTVSNPSTGASYTFQVCQDGTGSRTFTWPASFKGTMTIASALSKCNLQTFVYDGTNYYAVNTGVTGE